ncbi:MAG TPA: hypothetical protein VJT71_14805 [Pyrinomonadaceae bacterium]|nr:hypothetical protein [Pyrinomonadaceae bacterium]
MKRNLHWVIGFALIFSFQSIFAQNTQPPSFEKYPADVYAGKPAPLNLRSHRLARLFRTSIREQLKSEGINFAGHYTIAVMGCGTGCSITAIIDARNGRAYFPQVFEGWTSEIGDYQFGEDEDIRTFKVNSRLIKAIGRPRISTNELWGASGIYYYEWKNNELRQVHFTPAGSYPRADRP